MKVIGSGWFGDVSEMMRLLLFLLLVGHVAEDGLGDGTR